MKGGGDIAQVVSARSDGIALRIKVVPGASRTKVAGVLGDRLKVSVAAPPEDGKANRAACELIAALFAVAPRDVVIAEGQTQPRKTVVVAGVSIESAKGALQAALLK